MFCREALADLAGSREKIEAAGMKLAIVSLAQPQRSEELVNRFGLGDVPLFDDTAQELYRGFELRRASKAEFVTPTVGLHSARATLRYGFGSPQGDVMQMPGTFVIDRGRIVRAWRPRVLGDRLDPPTLMRAATGRGSPAEAA